MLLRINSKYNYDDIKHLVAALFLTKSFANIVLHFVVNDTMRRIMRKVKDIFSLLIYNRKNLQLRAFLIKHRRRRAEVSDSVASISHIVN